MDPSTCWAVLLRTQMSTAPIWNLKYGKEQWLQWVPRNPLSFFSWALQQWLERKECEIQLSNIKIEWIPKTSWSYLSLTNRFKQNALVGSPLRSCCFSQMMVGIDLAALQSKEDVCILFLFSSICFPLSCFHPSGNPRVTIINLCLSPSFVPHKRFCSLPWTLCNGLFFSSRSGLNGSCSLLQSVIGFKLQV